MVWNNVGNPFRSTVPASETTRGLIELATTTEAIAGTDIERAVTPAGLKAGVDNANVGKGYLRGEDGRNYQIISAILRNTGTGFEILNDAAHTPHGVSHVTQDDTFIKLWYNFTAVTVNVANVTPDEAFARAGYTAGPSVGLDAMSIAIGQPGGISDYIYSNGTAWNSLNGIISVSAFNATSGAIDLAHQDVGPVVGGSVTSRSFTNRATLDSMSQTTSRVYLVNSSGTTAKTHSSDHRFWINRTGTRFVKPSEMTQNNSNLWVWAVCEI